MKLIYLKKEKRQTFEKGQAFSTFQLLIAAVVALALLGVLMPIISNINPGTGRVVDALNERINTQQDQPGTLSLTDDLKISGSKDPYISTATVTKGTGMDAKQVLFMTNGYTTDFSTTGPILEIKNQSTITYKFGVLCQTNVDALNDSISNYSSVIKDTTLDGSFDAEDIRVCVIFPVKK